MSEPGFGFCAAWRDRMAESMNGTWSNHSGFLSHRLSRDVCGGGVCRQSESQGHRQHRLNFPEINGSNPDSLMAQYQAAVAAGSNPLSYISPDCARPLANCDANFIPYGATQIETNINGGGSSSNQMQVTVDRRMNRGFDSGVRLHAGKDNRRKLGLPGPARQVLTNCLTPRFESRLRGF